MSMVSKGLFIAGLLSFSTLSFAEPDYQALGKDATELQELVLVGPATPVEPSDKLATSWGRVKN